MMPYSRDPKILKFFFKYLKYGNYFGEFKVAVDNTCSIEVLLNGKTATIPLQFSTNKKLVF
jgi:hypothetical protein